MKSAKTSTTRSSDPVEYWDELLRPLVKKSPDLAKHFLEEVRAAKLTFGTRVHCPFLRPVFLSPEDETRVRNVAETIAAVAERLTSEALENPSLFEQFHLRPEEEKLVRMKGGYAPASAASRLDAFLLAGIVEVYGIQRRIAGRTRLFGIAV